MTAVYADTSAIVRAYLRDESDRSDLRRRILGGTEAALTSQIATVEFPSAIRRAYRAGRLKRPAGFLAQFDADCGATGPIALVNLEPAAVLPLARALVVDHVLSALDAIHLAAALIERERRPDLMFLTRDEAQAKAARAVGLRVE